MEKAAKGREEWKMGRERKGRIGRREEGRGRREWGRRKGKKEEKKGSEVGWGRRVRKRGWV